MKTRIKSGILLITFIVSALFAMPVMAEEVYLSNGFYDIGQAERVSIEAFMDEQPAMLVTKNIDEDEEAEQWYEHSNRLEVTYSAAKFGGYYAAVLVEGNDLPTVSDDIFSIDQTMATSTIIKLNVYPMELSKSTDMTLYISSSIEGEDLIAIPLSFAVGAPGTGPLRALGDVDNDGIHSVKDALQVLRIGAGKYDPTEAEKSAADVDGDGFYGVKDALLILQYQTGKISSFR